MLYSQKGSALVIIILIIIGLLILSGILFYFFRVKNTQIDKGQASNKIVQKGINQLSSWQPAEKLIKEGNIPPPQQILQIGLNYQQEATPSVKISSIKLLSGYAPLPPRTRNGYKLVALDSANKTLQTIIFKVPSQVHFDPPFTKPNSSQPPEEVLLNQGSTSFILTLKYDLNYKKLIILDEQNNILQSQIIENLEKIDTKTNFYSVSPEAKKSQSFLTINNSVFAAGDTDGKLDITFISDGPEDWASGFSNESEFRSVVNSYTDYLLTLEPFKSRRSQIRFNYFFNTQSLGCNKLTAHGDINTFVCDNSKVISQLQSNGVIYDKVYLIIKSNEFMGSASPPGTDLTIAVGTTTAGPGTFSHEFGHILGDLLDEYVYKEGNNIYNLPLNTIYNNCITGTPPEQLDNPDWKDIPRSSYFLGCENGDWYRSSNSSIMIGPAGRGYNLVSQRILARAIDYYAGPLISSSGDTKSSPSLMTETKTDNVSQGDGNTSDNSQAANLANNAGSSCGKNEAGVDIPCYKIGVFDEASLASTRQDAATAVKNYQTYSDVLDKINQEIEDAQVRNATAIAQAKNEAGKGKAEACMNQ